MKATDIKIAGFSYQPEPNDMPSIGGFGLEGTGKTRFACSMPHKDGVIGLLAIDKKSLRTFQEVAQALGVPYIANTKPFISDKDLARLAMIPDDDKKESEEKQKKLKEFYKGVVDQVCEAAYKLSESDQVESIVTDTTSQLFSWMQFKHFGRTNRIPPVSRTILNQDMIDFVNMLRSKNTFFIHRASEIWKKVGTNTDGTDKKEPSGLFEPDGYKGIGAHLTAYVEFTNNLRLKKLDRDRMEDEDQEDYERRAADKKFRVKMYRCQTRALLEGQDLAEYGVSGLDITWDNLMTLIGC